MTVKKKLGQLLLEAGVLDEYQLKSALGYQKQWGGRLGEVLVENRFITEESLVTAIHRQLGIPIIDLEREQIQDQLIKMVPVELAEKYGLVPLRLESSAGSQNDTLVLAMSDPTNLAALEDIQFHSGKRVKYMLAKRTSVSRAIRKYYHNEKLAPVEPRKDFSHISPEEVQFAGSEVELDEKGGGANLVLEDPFKESIGEQTPSSSSSTSVEEEFLDVEIVEDFQGEEKESAVPVKDTTETPSQASAPVPKKTLNPIGPFVTKTDSPARPTNAGAEHSSASKVISFSPTKPIPLSEGSFGVPTPIQVSAHPPVMAAIEKGEMKNHPAADSTMTEINTEELSIEVGKLLDVLECNPTELQIPQVKKASHLVAAIIRLLLRKEVFSETEFLDELKRR